MKTFPCSLRRCGAAFSIATALVGGLAHGEQSIEEITVTASHFPLASNQAAAAVSVIDQYKIDNRAALSMLDLLRDVPGMAVSQSGVLGSMSDIRVRGAEANQLLVLIDGIEANDPSQDDGLNWGVLSAADIERIEVIRGSQSALYGSDAMAGVVNIITRTSSAPLSAGLNVERAGNNTWQSGVNVGVSGDRYSLRLAASQIDIDGEHILLEGVDWQDANSLQRVVQNAQTLVPDVKPVAQAESVSRIVSGGEGLGSELRDQEYAIILDTLVECNGRRKDMADKLGISPRTLRYKLAKMRDAGIDIPH